MLGMEAITLNWGYYCGDGAEFVLLITLGGKN